MEQYGYDQPLLYGGPSMKFDIVQHRQRRGVWDVVECVDILQQRLN